MSCGPGGPAYHVDLAGRTASKIQYSESCKYLYYSGDGFVRSTHDGSLSMFAAGPGAGGSGCLFNANTQTFIGTTSSLTHGAAIANDGNLAATDLLFLDSSGNVIGRLAQPDVFYTRSTWAPGFDSFSSGGLFMPVLNDAGSLYYWAYPNGFDIIDVAHATLQFRFSLQEYVQNAALPIAIDTGGRQVFLVTDRGLTIVDLGSAPLSVGHLSPQWAAAGTPVRFRGSGFSAGTTVAIGGKAAPTTFMDENTLDVTVPNVSPGLQSIVLRNPDGTTYTLENSLTVQ